MRRREATDRVFDQKKVATYALCREDSLPEESVVPDWKSTCFENKRMKRLLVLSAVVCGSAMATPIGTCVPGAMSRYIGNPCGPGENIFDNFAYSGNADASRIISHFQMAGTEFRLVLPLTGAGFFSQAFLNLAKQRRRVSVKPNIPPAIDQIDGVKDQVQLVVANSPGTETGGPAFFASTNSITTFFFNFVSTLTGPGGSGGASPELSSFELGTDAVVPRAGLKCSDRHGLIVFGPASKARGVRNFKPPHSP